MMVKLKFRLLSRLILFGCRRGNWPISSKKILIQLVFISGTFTNQEN